MSLSYPEINGKPAALVTAEVRDVINIGNYQNVTHSFSASRFVEDDDEAIVAAYAALSEEVIGPELGRQREETLRNLGKE